MVKKMYNPPRENRVFSTLFSLGRKYAILDDFTQLVIPQHFIKSLGKKTLHKARNFVQKVGFSPLFCRLFASSNPGVCLLQTRVSQNPNPPPAKSERPFRKIQPPNICSLTILVDYFWSYSR